MLSEFIEELWDEFSDFIEDFWEHASHKQPRHPVKQREVDVNGVITTVRPAYLFAERIDNTLKVIFGVSIVLSAVTATFLGFTKLSDLLEVLITSFVGRGLMFVIGLSYLTTAIWKLMHLGEKKNK